MITSGKEVMFSPEFVCLSVCLSVSNITRKLRTDLDDIFRKCPQWDQEQVITFWGDPYTL